MSLNMRKRAASSAAAAAPSSASATAKGGAAAPSTVVVDPSVITPMDLGPGGRHYGPVTAIQRNPFYPAAYLTTGDWGVRLWHEKNRGPILTTPYSKAALTRGESGRVGYSRRDGVCARVDLSHYRCPLVTTLPSPPLRYRAQAAGAPPGRACCTPPAPTACWTRGTCCLRAYPLRDVVEGVLHRRAWASISVSSHSMPRLFSSLNPLHHWHRRQDAPAYSHRVSDVALASLAAQTVPSASGSGQAVGGRLLAVGDASGTVTLLEASPGLLHPQADERGAMAALLERESRREDVLEKRAVAAARAARSGSASGAAGGAAMLAAAAASASASAATAATASTGSTGGGASSPWTSRAPVPLGATAGKGGAGAAAALGATTTTTGRARSSSLASTTGSVYGPDDLASQPDVLAAVRAAEEAFFAAVGLPLPASDGGAGGRGGGV